MEGLPFTPETKASLLPRQRHADLAPGKRIGRLVLVDIAVPARSGSSAKWRCKCDCGTETMVTASSLRTEATRSCGCYWRDLRTQTVESMLVTERHGKLLFVREVEPTIRKEGRRDRNGLFRCDCGNETVANLRNVRRGLTTSCGCVGDKHFHKAFAKRREMKPAADGGN